MMKKLLALLLVMSALIAALPCNAFATDGTEQTDIIWFSDGSCIEVTITKPLTRIANTVSGSKTQTFKNSDGDVEWVAKLSASYVFTGGSYTCTSANCTITVYASHWYEISKSTNYAGNRATANFTMGKIYLGVTTAKPQYTLNLYCDVNGNLS